MSKHHVLSFKPQLRLELRGQHRQNETEQPDHFASLGDSITPSTPIRFSVHPSGAAVTPRRLGTGGAMSKFGIAVIAVVLVTALSSAAPAKGRGHFGLGPLGSVKFAFTE
jgi:hypothetical protein